MLRISGGKYRSRMIEVPEVGTVPTKNRVREAMMSICASAIEGGVVLDLFAGSGALGIESLSRGAKRCYFVDVDKKAAQILKRNLQTLKEENGVVLNASSLEALRQLEKTKFDLVFLDPPYAQKDLYRESLSYLLDKDMLAEGAVVMVEYEGELEIDDSRFSFRRDYTYGITKLIQLRE